MSSEVERRDRSRHPVDLYVWVSVGRQSEAFRHVPVIDLSSNGAAIVLNGEQPPVGDHLILLLPDPADADLMHEIHGIVAYSSSARVGVRLEVFAAAAMAAVLRFLNSR
ncbi:MAG: PilZ domain-containing protein [Gammaproteobacteria bacterium]|nr:PilZ domain-containing protein [Gammaproteobacteria bacterium]